MLFTPWFAISASFSKYLFFLRKFVNTRKSARYRRGQESYQMAHIVCRHKLNPAGKWWHDWLKVLPLQAKIGNVWHWLSKMVTTCAGKLARLQAKIGNVWHRLSKMVTKKKQKTRPLWLGWHQVSGPQAKVRLACPPLPPASSPSKFWFLGPERIQMINYDDLRLKGVSSDLKKKNIPNPDLGASSPFTPLDRTRM